MTYTLVIVESPAKCQKIEQYLGPGYKCIASYGHIQELNGLKSINLDTFIPKFTPMDSKLQQIQRIRQMITNSNDVLLATDDDREGEGASGQRAQDAARRPDPVHLPAPGARSGPDQGPRQVEGHLHCL